jgi:hypothetical protein
MYLCIFVHFEAALYTFYTSTINHQPASTDTYISHFTIYQYSGFFVVLLPLPAVPRRRLGLLCRGQGVVRGALFSSAVVRRRRRSRGELAPLWSSMIMPLHALSLTECWRFVLCFSRVIMYRLFLSLYGPDSDFTYDYYFAQKMREHTVEPQE